MFDEQRVNIMGNCQRIRGYCLYSSARRERWRGGERKRQGGSAKSVGGSARNKRVAGGAANRSHLLGRRWRASRAIAAIYERAKLRKCDSAPRYRNTRLSDDEFLPSFCARRRSPRDSDFSSSVQLYARFLRLRVRRMVERSVRPTYVCTFVPGALRSVHFAAVPRK